MFGRRHELHTHTHNESVTVHEHRAPTEASVRLLKDFEREAEKRLLAAVRVDDCLIDCVLHKTRESISDDHLYAVIFQTRGEKYKVDVRVPHSFTLDERLEAVLDAVSTKIAVEILSNAFHNTLSKFGEF